MSSVYFSEEHDVFRASVRRFVEQELRPHADQWEAEGFPSEVFRRTGEMGYLGLRFDEACGGSGLDYWYTVILCEELMRGGSIGVGIGLLVQTEMATSLINDLGTPEQKAEFLTPAIRGEKIAALGITEPGCGSDVAAIRTIARREGGDYVVNGAKTFITNGTRADFITLAVRTGGPGHGGISVLLFPTDTRGFAVSRNLKKMGTHSSDLAELFFDNCRVPARLLIGEEGRGFGYIMQAFQGERLVLASFANGIMDVLWEAMLDYGRARSVFGSPIAGHQVWRQRLADVLTRIHASRQLTYHACDRLNRGEPAQQALSMAKLFSSEAVKAVADAALQIHGGYGYMEESLVCRLYRDVAAFTVGAGTSEIMREIIAKEAGL